MCTVSSWIVPWHYKWQGNAEARGPPLANHNQNESNNTIALVVQIPPFTTSKRCRCIGAKTTLITNSYVYCATPTETTPTIWENNLLSYACLIWLCYLWGTFVNSISRSFFVTKVLAPHLRWHRSHRHQGPLLHIPKKRKFTRKNQDSVSWWWKHPLKQEIRIGSKGGTNLN